MAAAPATSTEFLDLVRKSGVIPAETWSNLPDLPKDPISCAGTLVGKGLMTKFQAKLLLAGRYKGFRLGSYVVMDQIGQGGMGAVYLAQHETLRRKVALKVLTPPKNDPNPKLTLERFIREARSAAALDHPNIVRIHDINHNNDQPFLVMEYVEGQSLDAVMEKNGVMAPSKAVTYIAQAAAGLQHAHEKGFIHRDIKPGNLMLAKDGTVKILDMGLARTADTSASDKLTEVLDKGAVVGTADYISPEQAMNGPLDIRSDIYSLGATFFALVTGQPPFSGNTAQKLLQHQLKEAPSIATIDKTFPPGLAEVVGKMLAKRPQDRYATPAAVIEAVAEWLPAEGGRRVVAGMSSTTLSKSGNLQNTLSEVMNTTKRIGKTQSDVELKKSAPPWKWIGIGGAVVAAGIVIAVVASGGKADPKPGPAGGGVAERKPDPVPEKEPPKTKPAETKKDPDAPPKPTWPKNPPGVLVRLPVSAMKPFTLAISFNAPGQTPIIKEVKDGPGGLPPNWFKWLENKDGEAQISFSDAADDAALRLVMTKGSGGVQVNSAPLGSAYAGTKVKLTVTYKTEPRSPGGVVRFRPRDTGPSTDVLILPATKGEWKTETKEVDLKDGNAASRFELFTAGGGADAGLLVKIFDVSAAP